MGSEPMVDQALRIAMLSLHTNPLAQPGVGDAGGMNVYVLDLARALNRVGVAVDVFTRASRPARAGVDALTESLRIIQLPTGPFGAVSKADLAAGVSAFATGTRRFEAKETAASGRRYHAVHSHYWLSGLAGITLAEGWAVPLVHTSHTLALVKNATLAPGDVPEPTERVVGEQRVVDSATALVANTMAEAQDLVHLYQAEARKVWVVPPGVDHSLFFPLAPNPAEHRAQIRQRLGLPVGAQLVLFAGRVQPHKGTDVLVSALAHLPPLVELVVLGGASGLVGGLDELETLARHLGVGSRLHLRPPVVRDHLADWYRAADVVAMPSHSESFGLVAAEAQACGTPVAVADVGGLRSVVAPGISGVLVAGHNPNDWARALSNLLDQPQLRARLAIGAANWAATFDWDRAAAAMLDVYRGGRMGP